MAKRSVALLFFLIFINLLINYTYITSENKNYFAEKEEPEYEWNSIKVEI